ncbi:hypothetical protein T439DRAFT_377732 [Meredithblackwellia eburnea MCA 4105]
MGSASPEGEDDFEGANGRKRSRTTTACQVCRRKRSKCDGGMPKCGHCTQKGKECIYDLAGDRRKPFTKDVVDALKLRITTLESELASLRGPGDAPLLEILGAQPTEQTKETTSASVTEQAKEAQPPAQDVFLGGLAYNSHGEFRFYGPTSSFRAVVVDESRISGFEVEAARSSSLTQSHDTQQAPLHPLPPPFPPMLEPALRERLIQYAFVYTGLVYEQEFYRDMDLSLTTRTDFWSAFLYFVVLGTGSRYLAADEDFPIEICSDPNDVTTRGDVFVDYARFLLDSEVRKPNLATIRGLSLMSVYLVGRGFDSQAYQFDGQAMRLCEDFGLHLGLHRLSKLTSRKSHSNQDVTSRHVTFWYTVHTHIILALWIGRRTTFTMDEIDQDLPVINHELEYQRSEYRSTWFQQKTKLLLIATKMMDSVYALRPGIPISAREAFVPELHLALESWYHALPTPIRVANSTTGKERAPIHIGLNLLYHTIMLTLHRPFFRRQGTANGLSVSTEKCLSASKHIVRLIKLQQDVYGVRFIAPAFLHAAFCAGTILAVSAVEDGISSPHETDAERKKVAREDLAFLTVVLRKAAETWPTASTSAACLAILQRQWSPGTRPVSGAASPVHPSTSGGGSATISDFFTTFGGTDEILAPSFTFPLIFPSWETDLFESLNYSSVDPSLGSNGFSEMPSFI